MGIYINPQAGDKENWLLENGVQVTKIIWSEVPEGSLPVVLMDNGMFTAAGVADSEKELQAFTQPNDDRPKKYYLVSKEKLKTVISLHDLQYL